MADERGKSDETANNKLDSVDSGVEKLDLNSESSAAKDTSPIREITQTDHLNKKLLNSFLDRLNTQSNTIPLPRKSDEDDFDELNPENMDFADH